MSLEVNLNYCNYIFKIILSCITRMKTFLSYTIMFFQSHNQGGPSNEGTTLTNVSSNGCQRLITPPRADQSRHCPADQMPHHLNENANNKQFHSAPSTSSNPPQRYSPELSRDENPHYYAINEQLYYFHQERMLRFQHQN